MLGLIHDVPVRRLLHVRYLQVPGILSDRHLKLVHIECIEVDAPHRLFVISEIASIVNSPADTSTITIGISCVSADAPPTDNPLGDSLFDTATARCRGSFICSC